MATTIGKGITIRGTIQADEPVTVAGTVDGDILASEQPVVIESGGHVDGTVSARTITVQGQSRGRLIAREAVRLQASATVKADVASPKFAVNEGATFNGSVVPARTDAAIRVTAYRNKAEAAAAAPVS